MIQRTTAIHEMTSFGRSRTIRRVLAMVVVGLVVAVALHALDLGLFSTGSAPVTAAGNAAPIGAPGASFVPYSSCARSWYVDNVLPYGKEDGTSWINAWTSFDQILWGKGGVRAGDCLWISGGLTSSTYSGDLVVGAAGTSDTDRITILSGQDPEHGGTVIIDGSLVLNNESYVTVDGEGADASTQHIDVVGGEIQVQNDVDPVVRFVEGDGSPVSAQYGTHGVYDHLYLHNESADSAIDFGPSRNPNAYNQTLLSNSLITVNNDGHSGDGSDAIQGATGLDLLHNTIRGTVGGKVDYAQHQDLCQCEASWITEIGNVFYDGADSSGVDYDCYNGSAPNHYRIFNNVFIDSQGGPAIRFYSSGIPCTSFDNIHIDNNDFVDHTGDGTPIISFYDFNGDPTVTNSEIENNIFYNDTVAECVWVDTSAGWTKSDWTIDYNVVHGCGGPCRSGMQVAGSCYRQAHGLRCAPRFAGYVFNSLATNLALAPNDRCVAGAGISLAGQFTKDRSGKRRPTTGAWDVGAYQRPPALSVPAAARPASTRPAHA